MRRFGDWAERIAADWMENPIQQIAVVQLSEFSTSHDGACRVSFGEDERIGFVKPREDRASRVIAHEKMASDLGNLLDLPVAPVVIRDREAAEPWNRFTALSLSCLASPREWSDAPPALMLWRSLSRCVSSGPGSETRITTITGRICCTNYQTNRVGQRLQCRLASQIPSSFARNALYHAR